MMMMMMRLLRSFVAAFFGETKCQSKRWKQVPGGLFCLTRAWCFSNFGTETVITPLLEWLYCMWALTTDAIFFQCFAAGAAASHCQDTPFKHTHGANASNKKLNVEVWTINKSIHGTINFKYFWATWKQWSQIRKWNGRFWDKEANLWVFPVFIWLKNSLLFLRRDCGKLHADNQC
jgi:hypothetical protein